MLASLTVLSGPWLRTDWLRPRPHTGDWSSTLGGGRTGQSDIIYFRTQVNIIADKPVRLTDKVQIVNIVGLTAVQWQGQ